MDAARFESLVQRLESTAAANPSGYRTKVALLALFGFLILGLVVGLSLLLILAVVGLLIAVAMTGGGLLVFLAKGFKLLILLVVPLWYFVVTAVKTLFMRFPPPEGRELKREEAPALFSRLDDMRSRMRGPTFNKVLLDDAMNAAVVQHPRLGLVGGHRNYLVLGLPMLQALSEREALAVVAHEYGHLAGNHGKFGAFIYRLRMTWGRIQSAASGWTDWSSRLLRRLFDWYGPYFNAYTFVIAREDEYAADRASAELVGADSAASALRQFAFAARAYQNKHVNDVYARVRELPEPAGAPQGGWRVRLAGAADETLRVQFIQEAMALRTGYQDTHPCLADRLKALQAKESVMRPAGPSAAQAWLGERLPAIEQAFDLEWRQRIAPVWKARHEEIARKLARLKELDAAAALEADSQWERVTILRDVEPERDRLPLARAMAEQFPNDARGHYEVGNVLLDLGDEAGVASLEHAMRLDNDAVKPVCERIYAFYARRDPAKAETYRAKWEEADRRDVELERQFMAVSAKDPLVQHELSADVIAHVTDVLRGNLKHVKAVFLARRILAADPSARTYILGLQLTAWGAFRSKDQQVVDRVAAVALPFRSQIVTLRGTYKPLLKKFRALPGARLQP